MPHLVLCSSLGICCWLLSEGEQGVGGTFGLPWDGDMAFSYVKPHLKIEEGIKQGLLHAQSDVRIYYMFCTSCSLRRLF